MNAAASEMDREIRRARPADAPAMAAVLAEAFAEFKTQYTPGAIAATAPSAEVIAQRFAEGPQWVAEADGVIVGTASAAPKGSGLYVRSLAVAPAARGRRLGARLMRQVEAYARAEGFQRMVLSTTPVLTGAIQMYAALGFERSGEGPWDLFGQPLFTMVKIL
jgi:ribosomal protein S18 acetylase RimI-like enzyme